MTDVFGELQTQIRSAALDHTLDPGDRYAKLSTLREHLTDALGELDRYRSDAQRVREADAGQAAREVLWARKNADIRETLLELGEYDASELDEMGLLSHQELDRLAEEGLLEEAVQSIARHWEEKLAGAPDEQQFGGVLPTHEVDLDPNAPPEEREAALARARHDSGVPAGFDLEAEHRARELRALADYHATKAETAERLITPHLVRAVKNAGGTLQGLDQRLKSRASIAAKIQRKRETMPLATDEERASHIADTLRYTAVFPHDGYNAGVEQTLGALEGAGFKRAHVGNFWGRDSDYNGLHVALEAPNGARAELQLHTPHSQAARDGELGHLRERFRNSQDSSERHDLWTEMHRVSGRVPKPKGAEHAGHIVSQAAVLTPTEAEEQRVQEAAERGDLYVRVDVPPSETHVHVTPPAPEQVVVPAPNVEVVVEAAEEQPAAEPVEQKPKRIRSRPDPDKPGERIFEVEE